MKINPSNGLTNQAINDRTTVNANGGKVSSAKSADVDRTTLSSPLPTTASMVKRAMQTPAVRQDKVNSLKSAIASGDYQIDSMKIATAITSESGS